MRTSSPYRFVGAGLHGTTLNRKIYKNGGGKASFRVMPAKDTKRRGCPNLITTIPYFTHLFLFFSVCCEPNDDDMCNFNRQYTQETCYLPVHKKDLASTPPFLQMAPPISLPVKCHCNPKLIWAAKVSFACVMLLIAHDVGQVLEA